MFDIRRRGGSGAPALPVRVVMHGIAARRLLPLAAVLLLVLVGACGSSEPDLGDGASTTAVASSADQAATVPAATATSAPVAETVPDVDGHPILADGLAAVGTRYAYSSTVTTNGVVTTDIAGVVYDDAFSAVIETAAATVEYRVTPDGEWTKDGDGEWVELAEPAPLTDPLASLRAPTDVAVIGAADGNHVLVATYPGSALGMDADTVQVSMRVVGGVLAEAAFEVDLAGQPVSIVTNFFDVGSVEPIESPES